MSKAKTKASTGNRKSKIRYSFPTVSICPRCGGTQTRAVSTQMNVQYRVCQAPICRHRYTVIGSEVKSKKSKVKTKSLAPGNVGG